MEAWQFDVVGGIGLVDGTELKALTGLDDHSRYCVSAARAWPAASGCCPRTCRSALKVPDRPHHEHC